jgi:RimJ/RimL family protein N-acetyltransferase
MTDIKSKNINFRLVEPNNAAFIVNLRRENGKYLSPTNNDVNKQIEWINKYKDREDNLNEFYYIIEDKSLNKVGTVRLYNINYKKKTFTFGSFIVDKSLTLQKFIPLEAITEIFNYAFNVLKLDKVNFDCRKNNDAANNFYKRFKAKIIDEDNLNYYYEYTKKCFLGNINHYRSVYLV